jgi:hypothetical protein
MRSTELLDGPSGEREAEMRDPAPEHVAELMDDAERALMREKPAYTEVTGEPILIVPGVISHVRLPKLIPDDWRPNLTDMIMQAVEHDRELSQYGK